MDKDTELLKIQTYADYAHSKYTTESSFLFGVVIALLFTALGLRLQQVIALELYYIIIFVPLPFFGYWLIDTHRRYVRRMARIDGLIKKVNTMQSLPTLEDLIDGKAWEKENEKTT